MDGHRQHAARGCLTFSSRSFAFSKNSPLSHVRRKSTLFTPWTFLLMMAGCSRLRVAVAVAPEQGHRLHLSAPCPPLRGLLRGAYSCQRFAGAKLG
jgi:hypothetical protein